MDYAVLVRSVIADRLHMEAEKITDESNLMEDLGADSLDAVEMLVQIEDMMEIVIPDEDIMNLRTVGEVITYLKNAEQ